MNVSNAPKVSVIMNCHNSSRYLKEAIDSVYAQTYHDWEIIFWDNASTDGSAAIAKGYTDGRLRYFKNPDKTSLGKARNLALNESRGRYIAFLDCDDIWTPDKLAKQVALLDGDDDLSFVYSNYYTFNLEKNLEYATFSGPQPEGLAFEQFFLRYPIGILTVLLRKDRLLALDGLFDDKLSCIEEYDLFMRYLAFNKAAYMDEPLGYYRVHTGMTTISRDVSPVDEQYYVFDKLSRMFPQYFLEGSVVKITMLKVKGKLAAWKAKRLLSEGDASGARLALAGYRSQRLVNLALYTATFAPKFIVSPVLGAWKKIKPF